MGLKKLFNENEADLSKINENLFVSSFLQKTFIRVDDKGEKSSKGFPAANTSFKINRPFIFFIIDKNTKFIMTMGLVREI